MHGWTDGRMDGPATHTNFFLTLPTNNKFLWLWPCGDEWNEGRNVVCEILRVAKLTEAGWLTRIAFITLIAFLFLIIILQLQVVENDYLVEIARFHWRCRASHATPDGLLSVGWSIDRWPSVQLKRMETYFLGGSSPQMELVPEITNEAASDSEFRIVWLIGQTSLDRRDDDISSSSFKKQSICIQAS